MTVAPSWFVGSTLAPVNEAQRASVRQAQRVLRIDETGDMDANTKAHLRAIQSLMGLPVTGILDEQTAIKIEQIRTRYT